MGWRAVLDRMDRDRTGLVLSRPWLLGACVGVALFAFSTLGLVLLHEYADDAVDSAVQKALRGYALAAARTVDPSLHAQVRSATDDASPAYQRAIEPLEALQRSLPDVRYLYTFRPAADGRLQWILDPTTEPVGDAPGHVAPGTPCEHPEPAMLEAVRTHAAAVSPAAYSDEWGSFMSAYAPVMAPDGSVECYVGVDMDAHTYTAQADKVHVAAGIGFAIAAAGSAGCGVAVASWRGRRIADERRAHRMREQLEHLTENVPGGIFVLEQSPGGVRRVAYASLGFRQLCDADSQPNAPEGCWLLDMLHPDEAAAAEFAIATSLSSMTLWHGEYRARPCGGTERWIEVRAMPRADGPVVRWSGFAADVTARRATQVALERARTEAERASQAKSEMVANVSHEIRTPMTAILGFAEVLREQHAGEAGGTEHEALDAILRNGEHLLGVVNDLVDVARAEAGAIEVRRTAMDLVPVARDAVELLAVRARAKGIAIELRGDSPVMANGDPLRVRQILLNLVANAIRFTDRGGVTVAVQAEGDDAWVDVRDSGAGMDQAQLSRLFRRFSQVDPARAAGGSGIGLALSRHLARMIGGDITVASEPGTGTTFRLQLRRHEAGSTAGGTTAGMAPDERAEHACVKGTRVLLVDDGEDNLRLLRHHLVRAGAEVTTACNGREAFALVQAARLGVMDAPFDLVLMDLEMPVMDGYEAVRLIREASPDLPVVAVTAQPAAHVLERCSAAGFVDAASKPIDRRALVRLVARRRRATPARADAAFMPLEPA